MPNQPRKGDPCPCADALNFGEPRPDCECCKGTGRVKNPDGNLMGVFSDKEDKADA